MEDLVMGATHKCADVHLASRDLDVNMVIHLLISMVTLQCGI